MKLSLNPSVVGELDTPTKHTVPFFFLLSQWCSFGLFVPDVHIRDGEGGFCVQNVQPSSAFLCDGMNVVIPKG